MDTKVLFKSIKTICFAVKLDLLFFLSESSPFEVSVAHYQLPCELSSFIQDLLFQNDGPREKRLLASACVVIHERVVARNELKLSEAVHHGKLAVIILAMLIYPEAL